MQIKCPACNATFPLEAAIALDAARSALLTALRMPAPLAGLIAQYLGFFRPKGRVLAMDRADRIMAELVPMLEAEMVQRNGVARTAPLAIWQQALEQMLELRNADKLRLPLKSHGYLLEIVFAAADRRDAASERAVEADRRTGQHRVDAARRVEQIERIARIRGDLDLRLIDRDEAGRQLAAIGLPIEVIGG